MIRYAIIRGARDAEQLWAYLPSNYTVLVGVEWEGKPVYVIGGKDNAGWTLHGYVIPRLASGLIWGDEIDLSHPIMRRVPT